MLQSWLAAIPDQAFYAGLGISLPLLVVGVFLWLIPARPEPASAGPGAEDLESATQRSGAFRFNDRGELRAFVAQCLAEQEKEHAFCRKWAVATNLYCPECHREWQFEAGFDPEPDLPGQPQLCGHHARELFILAEDALYNGGDDPYDESEIA